MRKRFIVLYIISILTLSVCAFIAKKSKRDNSQAVFTLLISLIPPVVGNLLIIATSNLICANIGYYIYFLGMDSAIFSLLLYTFPYCHMSWKDFHFRKLIISLFSIDILQYLLNPFIHFTFSTYQTIVDEYPYHSLIPYIGQTYHRILNYGVLFIVMIIFVSKIIKVPKVYKERYIVLFITMLITTLWETYYIFSGTPIDTAMVGFAAFGLMVFYFTIQYQPLRLLDNMLATMASEMSDSLFFFDADKQCIWANNPGIQLTQMPPDANYNAVKPALSRLFNYNGRQEEEWSDVVTINEGENKQWFALEKHKVIGTQGQFLGSFLSVRDITKEQKLLLSEKYSAEHDNLTGLYNREYLYKITEKLLEENKDKEYSIIYIDINDFKIINDIFGNKYGDGVLIYLGKWLLEHMPKESICARLTGDKFAVLVPYKEINVAELEKLFSSFHIENDSINYNVLLHVGIYKITEPDIEISQMYDRALIAMLSIKNEYQVHVVEYNEEMRQNALWGQQISNQLPNAIETKQLQPYLQAMVDKTGKLVGAEALVRWNHPVHGLIPPVKFIPVFEKNGMVAMIDKYMWNCACEILATWKEDFSNLFISVNISPKDFYFMDVQKEICDAVKRNNISPSSLRLEITETVMMSDVENRIKILEKLKSMGFIVEMDDFGSGFSSLNLLKDMPVDVLKVDMMFLTKTTHKDKATAILHNIMDMSETLGIEALTEGVETSDQFTLLSSMGCKLFQGYYFAKPMPLEEFEKTFLKKKKENTDKR